MNKVFIFILILLSFWSKSQPFELDNKGHFFSGGNIGLQFGTITLLDLSPYLGYYLTNELVAGVGVTYQYYKNSYYNYTTDIYGGRLFSRYFITEHFFPHAELEMLNLEVYNRNRAEIERMNVFSTLVGAGYRQEIARNAWFNILILWNITPNEYSPYVNPILRGGITIGL